MKRYRVLMMPDTGYAVLDLEADDADEAREVVREKLAIRDTGSFDVGGIGYEIDDVFEIDAAGNKVKRVEEIKPAKPDDC